MKSPLRAIALVVAACGLTLPELSAEPFSFFKSYWGDVLVATDMTAEGRLRPNPTQEKPVYYLGRSLGCRLGSIAGDQLPDAKTMTDLVVRVLAKQGYRGAQPGVHEPSLFLILQWGYLTPRSGELLWFLGYNAREDIAAPAFPGILGPEVFRRNMRSRAVETILDSADGPLYGIIVSAFDYATVDTANPVIVWQTRIGLPANGKSMAEALPVMLVAAAASIGEYSERTILADADAVRDGRVELGELKAIEVVNDHTIESGSRSKKP